MQDFYNQYFSPASTKRARISVHLHARGAGEADTKIADALAKLGLNDVPVEKRQSVDTLRQHLKDDRKLPDEEVDSIVSQAKTAGLKQAVEGLDAGSGGASLENAVEITDLRQFKSGLQASAGARPVKDLSSFEELDAKL